MAMVGAFARERCKRGESDAIASTLDSNLNQMDGWAQFAGILTGRKACERLSRWQSNGFTPGAKVIMGLLSRSAHMNERIIITEALILQVYIMA